MKEPSNITAIQTSGSLMPVIEKLAMIPDADIGKLEKLLTMQQMWQKEEARKDFLSALAQFQAHVPPITKNKRVHYAAKGGTVGYHHSDIENTVNTIKASLAKFGFSFRFKQTQDNNQITVTCVIAHIGGHEEETALSAPIDTSGAKNAIQGIGSTVQYIRRYTLCSALGLVSTEEDNDAQSLKKEEQKITKNQELEIISLCEDVGVQLEPCLKHFNIMVIGDLPARLYQKVIYSIEKRRKTA